jgi:hypothetical protein
MKLAYAFAAMAAAALTASAAQAATYINYGPVGADGGFTITFGNTGITDTNITDVFDFDMPKGWADFVISSTATAGSQKITWSSLSFDGAEFDSMTTGPNELNFLNGVSIGLDSEQRLVLKGISGGNASYSGVITFMPTDVPEPGAWALMILGFGGAGAMVRRHRAMAAA